MTEFDLGFLGGGQLARMSIQAAQRMGLKCLSLDPGENTPASQIAPAVQGMLSDPEKIAHVLRHCQRVTLENEFIPGEAVRQALDLSGSEPGRLIPGVESLETIQDKLLQRRALLKAGVPSPRAVPIEGDGSDAIQEIGFPIVLKARFGGYDGKGTRYAKDRAEFDSHRELWSKGNWMAETFVRFRRELAVMVFVPIDGPPGTFPTMETVQTNHVCDLVFPCDSEASSIALAAIEAIRGVGLFGVELFEEESGRISVNEIAPRPHNTGHYTLDWGGVSQFEQHVRLVMGFPTVQPDGAPACMANLLGQNGAGDFRLGLRAALEAEPAARVHWYGKEESRPGRKMGHINTAGENVVERAKRAREGFYGAWTNG